jgi:hypothetical protein
VVDDEVKHDLHAPVVAALDDGFDIFETAVFGSWPLIVADVVACQREGQFTVVVVKDLS